MRALLNSSNSVISIRQMYPNLPCVIPVQNLLSLVHDGYEPLHEIKVASTLSPIFLSLGRIFSWNILRHRCLLPLIIGAYMNVNRKY